MWPACEAALAPLGFARRQNGLFKKRISKDIALGVHVDITRRTMVTIGSSLMIFHQRAARVVDDGLKAAYGGTTNYSAMAIDVTSLRWLLKRHNHPLPPAGYPAYPILDEAAISRVASYIVESLALVADAYFANAASDERLISYFESHKDAGGTAHEIKLLSLYFVTGEREKLHDLLARVSPSTSVPMTVAFKTFLLNRIANP